MRPQRLFTALLMCTLALSSASSAAASDPPLTTTRIASGFSRSIFLTSPPEDYRRQFVVEQRTGQIKIIASGVVLPTPFLDIDSVVIGNGNERGLLGMAFHPDYGNNGYFYVNYNRNGDGDTVIARYQVSADPNVADPMSATILQTIDQPFSNHNGGMLAFGADGYLYIGLGDGGGSGDPQGNGQNRGTLLGKMLRIDVDDPSGWGIPSDNPFVNDPATRDEIWALGLRNPWRYSFDRATGDLYIGDVGQNQREEVDFQPVTSAGGENYGWSCMEGFSCFNGSGCTCNDPSLTLPVHDYGHNLGCSITGGYVYRGKALPGLEGTYFFADYCTSSIWSFRYDGATMTDFQDRTAELAPPAGQTINSISSFGQDAWGELYILDLDGEIYKIVAQTPTPSWSNYGTGWPGTAGIPGFTLSDLPRLCTTVDLQVDNSLGSATTAALLLGLAAANTSTPWDGTVLVAAPSITYFPLAAGGESISVALPCDPVFCNLDLYLQVLEMDPGASKGVSFTAGMEVTLGL